MIYLDYMSTTPVDPRVAKVMQACLTQEGTFGNAMSSTHRFGFEAKEKIDHAREQIADLIHVNAREIIFTSGATESINLAQKGAALFYQRQGKHIISMSTEHQAVLNSLRYLESLGFEVTYLDPEKNGLLNFNQLEKAIRSDTILASIMHVNNETGVIQDIESIAELLKSKGVLFHVDAAQSAGKIPIDLKKIRADLMSFSAHKIYGPKGVGALFVRHQPCVQLIPLHHGASQENNLRAGTLATHQIAGMGEAFAIAKINMKTESERFKKLRDYLWDKISSVGGVILNGDAHQRISSCLNFSVDGIDAELFLKSLYDVAISTGSACNSANSEPSPVLIAMGLSRTMANRSFRISFGRFTTESEIEQAGHRICEQINKIR